MGSTATKGGGDQGVSNFDQAALLQSLGIRNQAIANRYAQLGEEVVPSTMQAQDEAGNFLATQAAEGQLQNANLNNPGAPGSPANLASLAEQNARLGAAIGRFGGGGSTGNFGAPPQSNITNVGS